MGPLESSEPMRNQGVSAEMLRHCKGERMKHSASMNAKPKYSAQALYRAKSFSPLNTARASSTV